MIRYEERGVIVHNWEVLLSRSRDLRENLQMIRTHTMHTHVNTIVNIQVTSRLLPDDSVVTH